MLPVVPLNTSDTIVFVGDSITDAEKCEVTYDQLLLEAKKPSDCQIVLPALQNKSTNSIGTTGALLAGQGTPLTVGVSLERTAPAGGDRSLTADVTTGIFFPAVNDAVDCVSARTKNKPAARREKNPGFALYT